MADAARARKVADRIHETVARLLQGRIKDPRLGFVTVTDVRVTGDLQQATRLLHRLRQRMRSGRRRPRRCAQPRDSSAPRSARRWVSA